MSDNSFIHAAQLNSTHAILRRYQLDGVLETVRRAASTARLEILISGGEEVPELYRALTGQVTRPTRQVFLWYATLADNPVLRPDDSVVNYLGVPPHGWHGTGPDEGETFTFACPNHPGVRQAVLNSLERQLTEYPFDGVFLDKIRFPSPANGLEEVFSCFCPYCHAAAARDGLDLDEAAALLKRISSGTKVSRAEMRKDREAGWLEKLIGCLPARDGAVLNQALRFRARSITRLVEDIRALTGRMGCQLALDLFSPGLAYLVGQDYAALARLAAWVKPMVYRYALGPAGLRLEIPQLVRGFEKLLHLAPGEAETWAQVAGMAGSSLAGMGQNGAPPDLISLEMERAVALLEGTPTYMGIEAVSIPAFNIRVTPNQVREMVSTARTSGARGVVLSWDLLSMPLENLRAAAN